MTTYGTTNAVTAGGGTPTPTQTKEVQATAFPTVVTPDEGYALSQATVTAPANLTAENIKAGVAIAGVTGSFEGTEVQVIDPVAELLSLRTDDASMTSPLTEGKTVYYDDMHAFFKIIIPTYAFSGAPINKLIFNGSYPGTGSYALSKFRSKGSSIVTIEGLDTKTFSQYGGVSAGFLANCLVSEFPAITCVGYLDDILTDGYIVNNKISIPEGITSIGDILHNAKFISSESTYTEVPGTIVIPSSVTEIKYLPGRTYSSSTLVSVEMKSTTPPTLTYASSSYKYKKIIVPAGCLETYQSATNWVTYADIMEEATQ